MPAKKNIITGLTMMILTVFICVSMCVPICGNSESDNGRSITLICRKGDTVLTGMQWKLYKVGQRSEDGVVLTGEFADYPIDMSSITEENVEQKAKTLESYAVADGIQPLRSGGTDENGELVFGSLSSGVYLAVGKNLRVEHTVYVPSSLLLEANETDTLFSYDAYPKITYATLGGPVAVYTVKKVWVDDTEGSIARPVNVTVDLFRNEELYDTIVLSSENGWEHSWKDLDTSNSWHVAERNIPVDYTVLIDFNMTQYLIKNSYKPEASSAIVTGTRVTTSSVTGTTGTVTATNVTRTTMAVPSATTAVTPPLIQTGQLWWPVIVLIAAGILLICAGVMIKKDEK